jgi:hypothetical protein
LNFVSTGFDKNSLLEFLIEIYGVNLFLGQMEQYKLTAGRNWKAYNEILSFNKIKKLTCAIRSNTS